MDSDILVGGIIMQSKNRESKDEHKAFYTVEKREGPK